MNNKFKVGDVVRHKATKEIGVVVKVCYSFEQTGSERWHIEAVFNGNYVVSPGMCADVTLHQNALEKCEESDRHMHARAYCDLRKGMPTASDKREDSGACVCVNCGSHETLPHTPPWPVYATHNEVQCGVCGMIQSC